VVPHEMSRKPAGAAAASPALHLRAFLQSHRRATNETPTSCPPPFITQLVNQKESITMPITIHEGESIIASTLVVEEHIFINCKLKNCRLYYSGGPFEWTNTSFEDCYWGFRGPAKDTVMFCIAMGMLKQGQAPPQTFQGNAGPVN
jgi:hypothetical protein